MQPEREQDRKSIDWKRLSRFVLGGSIVAAFSFICSTLYSQKIWENYWQKTIYQVQTTDFNILSHTLPSKLSQAILKDDRAEIQRTLNSNYGLFGIVITDCQTLDRNCPQQKILYSSDSHSSWKTIIDDRQLFDAPYNILRDPPPLIAEGGYSNPQDLTWETDTEVNRGKIIGRVYYLRDNMPSFAEDYQLWLRNIFDDRATNRPYLLAAISFSSSGLFAWLIVWLRVEKLLQQRKDDRRINLQETQRQQEQISCLQAENDRLNREKNNLESNLVDTRQERDSLERELAYKQQQWQELYRRTDKLNEDIINRQKIEAELEQKIEQLKSKVSRAREDKEIVQASLAKKEDEASIIKLEYERAREELNTEKIAKNNLKVKLDITKQEIEKFKQLLEEEDCKSRSISQDLDDRKDELKKVRDNILQKEEQLEDLELEITYVDLDKNKLQRNLKDLSDRQKELDRQIESLKSELEKQGKELLTVDRERKQLQAQLNDSKTAEELLKEAITREEAARENERKLKKEITLLQQMLVATETQKLTKSKEDAPFQGEVSSTVQKRGERQSNSNTNRETNIRRQGMNAIKFAMTATIIVEAIPNKKVLQQQIDEYYDREYGSTSKRSIKAYEIVNYLRHAYSNYNSLYQQFKPREEKREEAHEILQKRTNAIIWSRCQEWLSSLRD